MSFLDPPNSLDTSFISSKQIPEVTNFTIKYHKSDLGFAPELHERFAHYRWRGNIREIQDGGGRRQQDLSEPEGQLFCKYCTGQKMPILQYK
jgi:hypothetical protein